MSKHSIHSRPGRQPPHELCYFALALYALWIVAIGTSSGVQRGGCVNGFSSHVDVQCLKNTESPCSGWSGSFRAAASLTSSIEAAWPVAPSLSPFPCLACQTSGVHDTPQAELDTLVIRSPVSDLTSIASACLSTIVLNSQTLVLSGMFLLKAYPMQAAPANFQGC